MKNFLKKATYFLMTATVVLFGTFSGVANAEEEKTDQEKISELREQIDELNNKISEYNKKATELSKQADTLANEISRLKNEQETIKAQIKLTQAEHDQLVIDIDLVQQRIDENSDTIGYVIAQYYYNSDISTIERLASSENFASFIDEEVRLTSLSDTLAEIVEENKNLRAELVIKKQNAETLLTNLEYQRQQLAEKEAEQAKLLRDTRNSEEEYKKLREGASEEKQKANAELQELLAVQYANSGSSGLIAGDPGKGGYPYSDVCPGAQDTFADPWGMYVCECVSYTAWKVEQMTGRSLRWGGVGNANQWPGNARNAGIGTGYTPRAGSVGVMTQWPAGPLGHVVWVEFLGTAENGHPGEVYVSQYNWGIWGEYSEMWYDADAFEYIYF